MADKKGRLREIANGVYLENKLELDGILKKIGVSRDELIAQYIEYNEDISVFSNEIYGSMVQRAVMYLHNLNHYSYHHERQKETKRLLDNLGVSSVVDIGFAAPYSYMKDIVEKGDKNLTLLDVDSSAEKFSREVFKKINSDFENYVSFREYDMNSGLHPGEFDCYLFMDSIEHARDPTKYLEYVVENSPRDAKFVFALPISDIVPCHNIAWKNVEEARRWLDKCGLKILEESILTANPDVDLFAEEVGGFTNYLAS